MVKEKIIFWLLLAAFMGILLFGFLSQGKKKEATEGLMKEIELATKRSKIKKDKMINKKWSFKELEVKSVLDDYPLILKRSPFFRVVPENKIKKVESVVIKEEPEKVLLQYKGKLMMGSSVRVVIEDAGTGKSFFLQEGDMVGDFKLLSIGEKEVTFRNNDGKELVLRSLNEQGR